MDRPDKRNSTPTMTGRAARSRALAAGKEQWQELIDYYFARTATASMRWTEAVGGGRGAAGRGARQKRTRLHRHFPIRSSHHHWIDPMTSYDLLGRDRTGRRLDFIRTEDRMAACRWYIDTVREAFARGQVRKRRAGGILLAARNRRPARGYRVQLPSDPFGRAAAADRRLPARAELLVHLDSLLRRPRVRRLARLRLRPGLPATQPLLETGERHGRRMPVDQPRGASSIEFEFEASILNARENSGRLPQARLRDYMRRREAVRSIYGSRPIAYYQGSNALYDLSGVGRSGGPGAVPRVLPFRGRESAAVEIEIAEVINDKNDKKTR